MNVYGRCQWLRVVLVSVFVFFQVVILAPIIAHASSELEFPSDLQGPYLGQTVPGLTAEVFAPDLVSVTGRYEFGVSFAPDGSRIMYTIQAPDEAVMVLQARQSEGRWTPPTRVDLTQGRFSAEMEAFFAPDGQYVYFAPYNDGMDVRLWRVEVQGEGWGQAVALAGDPADHPSFYPTCAADGTVYYTNIAERKPYRTRLGDDGTWTSEPLDIEFGGHCFVAKDQSFVLLDKQRDDGYGRGDIYVAFAEEAGHWSRPVNLGIGVNSAYSESCPSLSADEKYLFFSRYNETGNVAQIYWVDAGVIDQARRTLAGDQTDEVARIVHDSIAWAVNKDRQRLESIIAHDDDYFSFHPEGLVGVQGYAAFEAGFDFWMDPRFEAFPPDVRDFRCHFSQDGRVAWFSAVLDDCYTWDGNPGCWKDTRWTGVLEQVDGCWEIMQMHFSFAADRSESE